MSISLGSILSRLKDDHDKHEKLRGKEIQSSQFNKSRRADLNRNGDSERRESWNTDGSAIMGASRIALVENGNRTQRPKECWGARHTMAFMGFLGISCVYAMRVNLSVAIVAMVRSDPKNTTNNTDLSQVCLPPDDYDSEEDSNTNGEFDWDEATQGMILGSFFYGFILTNIIGGRAAEHFGGKLVYGLGIVLTGVFTVISPICAKSSTGLFIAIRVLEGAAEGVTFPSMNALLAAWIPPMERARFSALVYAGCQFGTVVTMPVSGWLCNTDFLGGWPSVFYIFGGLGILWGVAWFLLVFDYPEVHPRISQDEKTYLIEQCGAKREKPVPVPLKAIFTSVPFWAIMVVHFGQNWGFFTLLTELPTYLKNIQHYNITSNGLLSALPYFVMWIFSLIYSQVIDRLLATGKITTLTVRRTSMVIGIYGPMAGLIAMCFVDCDEVLAIVVLCIAVGLNGAIYCGYMCSHQDLAPNLAGTLMGITNTVSNIPGFVAPSVVGLIINGNQTLSAWRTVFLISAVIYLVTNTVYLIFISVDTQPWNFPKEEDIADDSKKKRY